MGVDLEPQPRYAGCRFVLGDALGQPVDLGAFDAIHASPPCQWGTAYRRRPNHVKEQENLVPAIRALLKATGLPYVIEQPETNRASLEAPVTLCGSSFGLDVRRHRCFETTFPLLAPPCDHSWQTPRFPPATNRTNLRSTVEVGVWRIPLDVQRKAMGIDWMELEELSEAIPPPFTEWIGTRLLQHLSPEPAGVIPLERKS